MDDNAQGFAQVLWRTALKACRFRFTQARPSIFIFRTTRTLRSSWSGRAPELRRSGRFYRSERQPERKGRTGSSTVRNANDAITLTKKTGSNSAATEF